MYGLVLDASSPLYGRADAILKITPIKVPYIQEALGVTSLLKQLRSMQSGEVYHDIGSCVKVMQIYEMPLKAIYYP